MRSLFLAALLLAPVMPAAAQTLDATTTQKLDAALTGAQRTPEERARDKDRRPKETLAFFGLRANMTVVEVQPGGGWWTDILAPVLRDQGKLLVALNTNPNANRQGLGATLSRMVAEPTVFDKVDVIDYGASRGTALGPANSADMVFVSRHMHGLIHNNLAPQAMTLFFAALKPGGVLAIEQQRWPEGGADPVKKPSWTSDYSAYVRESKVIALATAAGFRLAARSDISANPRDTRDHPQDSWSLPPNFAGGDVDKAKFAAIGEADRMTLKFVKP
ncbi:MAG: class I SAM-dependent methyltransferase [Sphingomonadaceae bacterium]